MKWYRIHKYFSETPITTVEVVKETDQQVVFMAEFSGYKSEKRRAFKAGEFFPTFDEAKAYLVKMAERELQNADDHRSRAIEKLKKYRAIESGEKVESQP